MNANESLARTWLESWNLGRPDLIDATCADEYMEYDPAFPNGQLNREGIKQAIGMYRRAFPDLLFTIEEIVIEGDSVALHWKVSGTNLGEFGGQAPTGKRGVGEGMTFIHIRNGKAVEARACWDVATFREQVGTANPPPATAGR
jgi:steroid delta-isomerase-like uncharacterized protein